MQREIIIIIFRLLYYIQVWRLSKINTTFSSELDATLKQVKWAMEENSSNATNTWQLYHPPA